VFVSPVTVASGFNTKNLLALGRGVPLVTTPEGATGLPLGAAAVAQGGPGGGAACAANFAALCAALHSDGDAWAAQGGEGFRAATQAFSAPAVRRALRSSLAALGSPLTDGATAGRAAAAEAAGGVRTRAPMAAGPYVLVVSE